MNTNHTKSFQKNPEKSKELFPTPSFLFNCKGPIEFANLGYTLTVTTPSKEYLDYQDELIVDKILAPFRGAGKERFRKVMNLLIWAQIRFTSQSTNAIDRRKYDFAIFYGQKTIGSKIDCTREWANKLLARLEEMGLVSSYRRGRELTKFYRVAPILFAEKTLQQLSRVFTSLKKLLVTTLNGKEFTLIELFAYRIKILFNIKVNRRAPVDKMSALRSKAKEFYRNLIKVPTSIASISKEPLDKAPDFSGNFRSFKGNSGFIDIHHKKNTVKNGEAMKHGESTKRGEFLKSGNSVSATSRRNAPSSFSKEEEYVSLEEMKKTLAASSWFEGCPILSRKFKRKMKWKND